MASKGMWRMIGRQVRSRRDRSIALGAGILVASVSFSLLTAAASTSQLEVHGTVENAPRPAYDILVRPKGAADAIETKDNLVRDNFLADTFGGISIAQWQKILGLPGVSVAAPIANIGYVILQATLTIPVGPLSSSAPQQLFRINLTWKAANGLSSYPGGNDYVYYTPSASFSLHEDILVDTTLNRARLDRQSRCIYARPSGCPPVLQNQGEAVSLYCFSGLTPKASTTLYGSRPQPHC